MANKTREKLKVYGFSSMGEMEARSRELRLMAFDMLERANHVAELLQDERFQGHADRYHSEWKIHLEENGQTGSFVSAQIDKDTRAVSATVNKDLLKDVTNLELLEPLVGSVIRSVDESYRKVHGLGFAERIPVNVDPQAGEKKSDS
jgi:hypothetical protein